MSEDESLRYYLWGLSPKKGLSPEVERLANNDETQHLYKEHNLYNIKRNTHTPRAG